MTPAKLSATVVAERIAWIDQMLAAIRSLPLENLEVFESDPRNVAAAESYLRRALEALLDLGRHLLAKGFGHPVTEYKAIASGLLDVGVLDGGEAQLFRRLAGYRNRMVHFYHELSQAELYDIGSHRLGDLELIRDALSGWIRAHPEWLDRSL